jgi:hypothetical protein
MDNRSFKRVVSLSISGILALPKGWHDLEKLRFFSSSRGSYNCCPSVLSIPLAFGSCRLDRTYSECEAGRLVPSPRFPIVTLVGNMAIATSTSPMSSNTSTLTSNQSVPRSRIRIFWAFPVLFHLSQETKPM